MLFEEADAPLLKAWVVKKLESISDADSEVLADYVLALVTTDEKLPIARANCTESLSDFLGDGTVSFVDDVFTALATKAYDPNQAQPKPAAPPFTTPRRNGHGLANESRKRSYHDWAASHDQNAPQGAWRPMKQRRRADGRSIQVSGTLNPHSSGRSHESFFPTTPGVPINPSQAPFQMPPLPPFDPNNPMAAMLALGQAIGLFQPIPGGAPGPQLQATSNQRCRDYDSKGFCVRSVSCPFEHSNPEAYDPMNVDSFGMPQPSTNLTGRNRKGFSDINYGTTNVNGGRQSNFYMIGPSRDPLRKTIVVERIPHENFDEQQVHNFFSAFGAIENIELHPANRLAIITFRERSAAQAAHDSPRSVFDNRFVKIYWHNPNKIRTSFTNSHSTGQAIYEQADEDTDPDFDAEKFARNQEAAQRRQEEKRREREANLKARQEIDDKLRATEAERKYIASEIAKREGKPVSTVSDDADDDKHTEMLKAQLAALQSEALSLGIDPNVDESASNGHRSYSPYRGRGGYRGWRGRGYHQQSYRGGYAGHGGHGGRVTMSLDNRPKTVSVTFADGDYNQHEEALRQYLMFNGLETATLSRHADREDTALVAFQHRFEGENFMGAAFGDGPLASTNLLHLVGMVELGWYKVDDSQTMRDARMLPEVAQEKARVEHSVHASVGDDQQIQKEDQDMDTYDEVD